MPKPILLNLPDDLEMDLMNQPNRQEAIRESIYFWVWAHRRAGYDERIKSIFEEFYSTYVSITTKNKRFRKELKQLNK